MECPHAIRHDFPCRLPRHPRDHAPRGRDHGALAPRQGGEPAATLRVKHIAEMEDCSDTTAWRQIKLGMHGPVLSEPGEPIRLDRDVYLEIRRRRREQAMARFETSWTDPLARVACAGRNRGGTAGSACRRGCRMVVRQRPSVVQLEMIGADPAHAACGSPRSGSVTWRCTMPRCRDPDQRGWPPSPRHANRRACRSRGR